MKAVGIIPARYGSTRLPAKALAMLNGTPLIQHVYEQARQAKRLAESTRAAFSLATARSTLCQLVPCVNMAPTMTSNRLFAGHQCWGPSRRINRW